MHGTSATINATPHLTRLLMLIKKYNGTVGEILPLCAGSLSPAISLTSDVPTGDDLFPYTGTAPATINIRPMNAPRPRGRPISISGASTDHPSIAPLA